MVLLMITGVQIRAALGIVGWSVAKLSEKSGVGTTTITQIKKIDGIKGNTEFDTLSDIKDALSGALAKKGMELRDGGVMPIDEEIKS